MAEARTLADSFVTELRGAVDTRLRAAALFGSAARDEWIEGISDVNVLVLFDRLDVALLARAAPAVRQALEAGVTPLVMEMDEWSRATDVFAIELADMRDAHVPLFGDDPCADPVLDPATLRLQAERELRARLLHLHAGMLVAAEDAERLGQLLALALPSFVTYMRAALRLAELTVPVDSRAVIEDACALVGADAAPFITVLDARRAGRAPAVRLTDPLADTFNTAATQLATYIDAFGR
jgi:predicted nucleotidyltransferase